MLQALQRVMLRTAYTVLDYAQTGLIASVFLFKVSSCTDTGQWVQFDV